MGLRVQVRGVRALDVVAGPLEHARDRFRRALDPAAHDEAGRLVRVAGESVARGPWNLDEAVSIARTFRFTEGFNMDLRWEMFNVFNRGIWAGPDSTLNSQNFGLVRSQANSPRQMQFGVKFRF
jgi:hypothetical protein